MKPRSPLTCGRYTPDDVRQIFHRADQDKDGVVAGGEAKSFFLGTGIPEHTLHRVWEAATEGQAGGLDAYQFSRALRLISLIQSGRGLSSELMTQALTPDDVLQLPTPKFEAQFLPEGAQQKRQAADAATGAAAAEAPPAEQAARPAPSQAKSTRRPAADAPASKAPPAASKAAPGTGTVAAAGGRAPSPTPAAAAGKSGAPQGTAAAPAPRKAAPAKAAAAAGARPGKPAASQPKAPAAKRSRAPKDMNAVGYSVAGEGKHSPVVAFRQVMRCPPQNEADAAPYRSLCAGNGLLFAAPTRTGGLAAFIRAGVRATGTSSSSFPSQHAANSGEDSASVAGVDVMSMYPTLIAGAVTCMHCCVFSDFLVTGHADGRVIVWSPQPGKGSPDLQPRLLLNAHRQGSVCAVVTTPWGSLWTASNYGSLRMWRDAMGEAAAVGAGAPPRAATDLLISVELRTGSNERAHYRIVALTLCAGGQTVACAGRSTVNLWDSQSGTFIGHLCNAARVPSGEHDIEHTQGISADAVTGRAAFTANYKELPVVGVWDDPVQAEDNKFSSKKLSAAATGIARRGFTSIMNKVKSRGRGADEDDGAKGGYSLDRDVAENPAVSGAADAASTASSRVCTVVAPADNSIWVVYMQGNVDIYNAEGKLLFKLSAGTEVTCVAAAGTYVWFGLASGHVSIFHLHTRKAVALIPAHNTPVIALQPVGPLMYTLALDGSIHAFNGVLMPAEATADKGVWCGAWAGALEAWEAALPTTVRKRSVRVRAVTWNVGESRPNPGALPALMGTDSNGEGGLANTDVVVVGLQEVEMGTASVAFGVITEVINKQGAESGNQLAREWADLLLSCAKKGSGWDAWVPVGRRQLSGMLVVVLASREAAAHIKNVMSAAVACGIANIGGNKGSVALGFQLFRQPVLIINSHFAAHQNAVAKRNEDYASTRKRLVFKQHGGRTGVDPNALLNQAAAVARMDPDGADIPMGSVLAETRERAGQETGPFRSADVVVWLGDFNYRIDRSRQEVEQLLREGRDGLEQLKAADQARHNMREGLIFHSMREGPLAFNPTFKFDKGVVGEAAYDSSEKQRVPAWTDRVFFRGSLPYPQLPSVLDELDFTQGSLAGLRRQALDQVIVRCTSYRSLPHVVDSDHKPVVANLEVEVPNVNVRRRRKLAAKLMERFHAQTLQHYAPRIVPVAGTLQLRTGTGSPGLNYLLSGRFSIENQGSTPAAFCIRGAPADDSADPDASEPCFLPSWLLCSPMTGLVPPGEAATVSVVANQIAATTAAIGARDSIDTSSGAAHSAKISICMDSAYRHNLPLAQGKVKVLEISFT